MIRKLNIVLVLAVVVLFGLKGLKSLTSGSPSGASGAAADPGAQRVPGAEFKFRVVYSYWPPYAAENPISNHNGYLLDVIRAIFPNVVFQRMNQISLGQCVKLLHEHSDCAMVSYGHHPALKAFPQSRSPIAYYELAVFTSRTNGWHYAGPASLDKLRLGCSPEYMETPDLENHKLTVLPQASEEVGWANEIRNGTIDGFVATHMFETWDFDTSSVETRTELRMSPPIGRVSLYLTLSDRDPAYAKRVFEAYEAGLERIRASGELGRIKQYYSFAD